MLPQGSGDSDECREELEDLHEVLGWLALGLAAAELVQWLAARKTSSVARAEPVSIRGLLGDSGRNDLRQAFFIVGSIATVTSLGFVVPCALTTGRPVGLLIGVPLAVLVAPSLKWFHSKWRR